MHQPASTLIRLALPLTLSLSAALPLSAAAQAVPGVQPGPQANPFDQRPGTQPQWLIDRKGDATDPDKLGKVEIFTVGTISFSLLDIERKGQFVRYAEGGLREGTVQVLDKSKALDRTFLLRAQCKEQQSYFGPVVATPALKPVEVGSVGELLFKQICTN